MRRRIVISGANAALGAELYFLGYPENMRFPNQTPEEAAPRWNKLVRNKWIAMCDAGI